MKRLLLPLAALTIAGLLLGSAPRAYACSCVSLNAKGRVEQADLVAIGTVAEVTFERPPGRADGTTPLRRLPPNEPNFIGVVKIRAERYLKGSGESQVVLVQGGVTSVLDDEGKLAGLELAGGPNCALFSGLPVAERYLLFLHAADQGRYETSWCSGSIRLDASRLSYAYQDSEEYVAALAEYDEALGLPNATLRQIAEAASGEPPGLASVGSPPRQPNDDFPWLPVVIGSTASAGALGAAAWLLRRASRA